MKMLPDPLRSLFAKANEALFALETELGAAGNEDRRRVFLARAALGDAENALRWRLENEEPKTHFGDIQRFGSAPELNQSRVASFKSVADAEASHARGEISEKTLETCRKFFGSGS